jgi:hypothetical protein
MIGPDPPARVGHVLEGFYIALLIAVSVLIVWFSVYAVYRLYAGQR